jgi:hypothetical protein
MLFHLTSYVPENSHEIIETRRDSLAGANFDFAGVRRTRDRRRNNNIINSNNISGQFEVESGIRVTFDDIENLNQGVLNIAKTNDLATSTLDCNYNINQAAPSLGRFSGRRKNNAPSGQQAQLVAKMVVEKERENLTASVETGGGFDSDRHVTASEHHRNRIDSILKDVKPTPNISYGNDFSRSPSQPAFSVEEELDQLENMKRTTEEARFSFDEATQSSRPSVNLGSNKDSNSVSARLRRNNNNVYNTEFRNVLSYIEKVDVDQLIDVSFTLREEENENSSFK